MLVGLTHWIRKKLIFHIVIICEVTRINASLENHYIDFKKHRVYRFHCVAKSESGEWKDFVIICEVTRINASLENHHIDFKKRFYCNSIITVPNYCYCSFCKSLVVVRDYFTIFICANLICHTEFAANLHD